MKQKIDPLPLESRGLPPLLRFLLPATTLLFFLSGATAEREDPPGAEPEETHPVPAHASSSVEGEDGILYSFRSENLPIHQALALFARANDLNIVPDPDVTGEVTVDVRNLPLDEIMAALLAAHGFYWEEQGRLIRVRSVTTRIFTIDYLRLVRSGSGRSAIRVASSSGEANGSSMARGGGMGRGDSAGEPANIQLSQEDSIGFWTELEEQLNAMKSADGSVSVNHLSGTVYISDHFPVVEKVAQYIEHIKQGIHRQVDIEARIYSVTLNRHSALGIDWERVSQSLDLTAESSTIINHPFGGETTRGSTLQLVFSRGETTAVLQALEEQGTLSVLSQPRIRTLNNQPALIKVGTDRPFFSRSSEIITTSSGGAIVTVDETVQVVTVGTVLSITPQISADGWVTMDISPVITRLVDIARSPPSPEFPQGGSSTAPVLDIKQSSSLVRVGDGDTIIIGGLIQDEETETTRKVPLLGSVPVLGRLFRGAYTTGNKSELVIFLTPTITNDSPSPFPAVGPWIKERFPPQEGASNENNPTGD